MVKIKRIFAFLFKKNAPMSIAYTGSFAPQFINGVMRIVAILSFSPLSVLVANTPGTAHPPDIPPLTIRASIELP